MLNFIATTSFGLESVVKREAKNLGFENITVSDGKVCFDGDELTLAKANLWFRCSDRILIKIGEFEATSFEELFEKTKALPWSDWITEDGEFTVTGKSVKSTLHSVPDCQAIVKKAIVENLKSKYHINWFAETGAKYTVQVALLNDVATLTINSSGLALNRRGYRERAVTAPLKETMAAALIDLSYWKKDRLLLDPFCGSGTIPIEAALIARNTAPGLNRSFASEEWDCIPDYVWKRAREEAKDLIDRTVKTKIVGYDIDEPAIKLAQSNAKKAGVASDIHFETRQLSDVKIKEDYGVVVTNPPYGERIGKKSPVDALYKDMGRIFRQNRTWSFYAISSDENFEDYYGSKSDKKRKLYNGNIKTYYYQYFGLRPPKIGDN